MHYNANGTGGQTYASGLRNAVGLAIQPGTGRLWAVDNGQDLLGDDMPPDEIDLITRGGNYGWPYCWGNGLRDTSVCVRRGLLCKENQCPLCRCRRAQRRGPDLRRRTRLPARYRGEKFVSYHGSESRSQVTGYKVVYIPVSGTHAGSPQDAVTGWLSSAGVGWGRPVGVLVAADGSLLISDDYAGVIYRIAPVGR